MEKILKKLVKQLLEFNDVYGGKIINKKEELDNYEDMQRYLKDLESLLIKLESEGKTNPNTNSDNLMQWHLQLGHLTWYFENMNEIVIKYIQENVKSKGLLKN